jgi:Predicted metal-binding protein
MKRRMFIGLIASAAVAPGVAFASARRITVHKDPNCGCCAAWASAFGRAGYDVRTVNEADMDAVKNGLEVPSDLWGCHTAEVDGYYLEGHVPLEAAEKLLRERPPLAGLAVAGMPSGSLGMGDESRATYDVMAVPRDGSAPYVYLAVRPS